MPKIFLPLSSNAKIEVKIGDEIKREQRVAWVEKEGEIKTISISALLKVTPRKAKKFITALPGTNIYKGELIACKEGLVGLSKTLVFSPITGKVESFDQESGSLFIREKGSGKREINSKVDGRVHQIKDGGIEIDTTNIVFFGISGQGQEVNGQLMFATLLDSKVLDKILIVRDLRRLTLSKTFALGARGIITASIVEEVSSVVDRAGFSCLLLSQPDFDNLKDFIGRQALLFPEEKMSVIL